MRFLAAMQRSTLSFTLVMLAGLFTVLPSVQAESAINRTRMLYSSSASYCSPPEVLLVNTVNLTLFPDNKTMEIALSAGSVENDVNVTVGVDLIAYSRSLIAFSLDLCSIGNGILCPLPTYQFTGGGVYPLPSAILDEIPDIAYSVPDLEAVATLTLTSSTGEEVGCIQVTLSNGNTMMQAPAKWATVGLAFLALFSSLIHSIIAQSVGAAQWRVVDVFMTIQHVAISALLSVNFPEVFVSFALNFAWSIGIVDIPSLQSSASSTRSATGGNTVALLGNSLLAQTARDASLWLLEDDESSSSSSSSLSSVLSNLAVKLSGASTVTESSQRPGANSGISLTADTSHFTPLYFYPAATYWKRAAKYAPNTGPGGNTVTQTSTGTIPLITNSSDTAQGGLIVFTQRANVPADNAFFTVLVSIIIFIGIILAVIGFALLIVLLFRRLTAKRENSFSHWTRRVTRPSEVGSLVAAVMGRTLMVIFPVYCIFAFYQWRFGDSWVPDFLAALFMVVLLVTAAVFFLPLFKHAWRGSSMSLYYGNTPPVLASRPPKRWGHMAHPYRPRFFWFSLAFLLMSILRACFIGFAQHHGFLQSVGLLVLEVIFFVVLCVLRVGRDKKSDAVFIVLALFRILSWAVSVAFTSQAGLTFIPRVIVGFVMVVVTGLPILYAFFFLVLVDLVTPFRRSKLRGKHRRYEEGGFRANVNGEKEKGHTDDDATEAAGTQDTAVSTLRESTMQPSSTSDSSNMRSSGSISCAAPTLAPQAVTTGSATNHDAGVSTGVGVIGTQEAQAEQQKVE